jgi:hypothetical protein
MKGIPTFLVLVWGFLFFFHTCGKPNPFLQFGDVAEVVIIRKNI